MGVLRVGIVSANWGALAHLPAWRSLPGVEVVGICTSRRETAEAAARRYQVDRPFWDAEAMAVDPDIDLIDCGTRPSYRQGMVLAALRHGKHVYNGIPFARSWHAAHELWRAWQASEAVGVVDAFAQWLPQHQRIKALFDAGRLGGLFGGSCTFNLSLFNRPQPHFPWNWFGQAGQGVSALRNLGSHALHTLLFLFGAVEEVVACDEQLLHEWRFPDGSTLAPETNDFANALLRFRRGGLIALQVGWSVALTPGWRLEAFGSEGRVLTQAPTFPTVRDTQLHVGTLDGGQGMQRIELSQNSGTSARVGLAWDVEPNAAYPTALSMQHMVDAIRGAGQAAPDFGQAYEVERILEAIRISALNRRWVKLAEVAEPLKGPRAP